LRLRLARRILQPNTSRADTARLIRCLKEPRLENLAAQALLYVDGTVEPQTRDEFQQFFMQCNLAALARLEGIPSEFGEKLHASKESPYPAVGSESQSPWWNKVSPPGPATGPSELSVRPPSQPDVDPIVVARVLWTQPFCEALEGRFADLRSLGESRGLLLLTATIPMPAARAVLHRALEKHWYEGPSAVFGTIPPPGFCAEPGSVFVLKSLLRRNATLSQASPRAGNPRGRGNQAPATVRFRDAREKQAQITVEWLRSSKSLLATMMSRLQAVSRTRKFDRSMRTDETTDLPIRLNAGTEIVATVKVELPGPESRTLRSLMEPLQMRYFRAEGKAKVSTISAHVKRGLQRCEEWNMPDGVWIDGYQGPSASSSDVSIDVFIRKVVPDAPLPPNQEQELIVEVLAIEAVAGPDHSASDAAEPTTARTQLAAP
jgi:hypothetical protein